jgi:hypothetical protein
MNSFDERLVPLARMRGREKENVFGWTIRSCIKERMRDKRSCSSLGISGLGQRDGTLRSDVQLTL